MSKIHSIKNGKLHIYIRTDKYKGKLKSDKFVGRTYIQGKQTIKSSGTNNLKQAKVILGNWFDELNFKKKHNIQIHTNSVSDLWQKFLTDIGKSTDREARTKTWYKERWNYISKCKEFMRLKVETMTADDIQKTYLMWRLARAKSQSKVLRSATITGDLMAISGFTSWCYRNKIRKDKLENIKKILSKKMRRQRTSRVGLTKEQYNHLLSVSRKRFKSGRTLRIRFERERLHHFIVFMVGTGLRVDECLSLHFEDIQLVDRQQSKKNIQNEIKIDEHSRYYCKIWVRQSKTKERECYSVSSSYYAITRLINLYKTTGLGQIKGRVWGVQSFREGLNSLLNEAKLKNIKRGDETLTVDSKSFRNTFIQFMLDKGLNSTSIAKNCGTSSTMIDKHYTANSALDSILDSWLQTGRTKLKEVS